MAQKAEVFPTTCFNVNNDMRSVVIINRTGFNYQTVWLGVLVCVTLTGCSDSKTSDPTPQLESSVNPRTEVFINDPIVDANDQPPLRPTTQDSDVVQYQDADMTSPVDSRQKNLPDSSSTSIPRVDSATDFTKGDDSSIVEKPFDASVEAGCPSLDTYHLTQDRTLIDIPGEASGIAWNQDTDTFFIVANLQGSFFEYDNRFQTMLRSISIQNMDTDTEGIAYLDNGWFAISVESNYVYIVQVDSNTRSVDGLAFNTQLFQPSGPPSRFNAGFEGIAYRSSRNGKPGRIFVCQEYQPMRVLQFDFLEGSPPYEEKSFEDGSLVVEEPWEAEQLLSGYFDDLAGMTYDETSDTILILSQQSATIGRVDPQNGTVQETLSVSGTSTCEGITLFGDCQIAVVSEPNHIQVYSPQAPEEK